MTSRWWYLAPLLALGVAGAAIGLGLSRSQAAIEELHRVAMPGEHEIMLPAGPTTLYAEARPGAPPLGETQVRCGLRGPDGAVELRPVTAHVSYDLGAFAGHSVLDVELAVAGPYQLRCRADDGGPFVIAIGSGIGARIVVAVVSGLVPALLGVIALIAIFVRRARQRRRLAAAPAPAA
jgi:hypothetical protein